MSEAPDLVVPPSLGRVAILGLGLIGGSIGLALSASAGGTDIAGWDPDEATLEIAGKSGAIRRAANSPEGAVGGADLVVLCAPLQHITPLLRQVAPSLEVDAVVTDVGSTKARIVREADEVVGTRFVGGHPMAGSEEAGIGAASAELFQGAAWVLTPLPWTDSAAIGVVCHIAKLCGAAVMTCTPDDHDRFAAYLSHLPHILAYGLAKMAWHGDIPKGAALAAGSFRDGTRVAKSDPEQWADILMDNRANAAEALGNFLAWSSRIRNALIRGERGAIANLLGEAHRARTSLPK